MRRIVYRLLLVLASITFTLWRFCIEHAEEIGDDDHYQQAALESCAFCTEDDEDETTLETRPESESSTTGTSEESRVFEITEDRDYWKRANLILGHMMWHWDCQMLYARVPEHTHKGFDHDAKV